MKGNQGGISINADSRGSATSLRAFIHHSLFVDNRNRPSLYMEGRQSSPYQEVTIFKNYFSQNKAAYADVIALRQVVSNFSYNYVHSNQGEQNKYIYTIYSINLVRSLIKNNIFVACFSCILTSFYFLFFRWAYRRDFWI